MNYVLTFSYFKKLFKTTWEKENPMKISMFVTQNGECTNFPWRY